MSTPLLPLNTKNSRAHQAKLRNAREFAESAHQPRSNATEKKLKTVKNESQRVAKEINAFLKQYQARKQAIESRIREYSAALTQLENQINGLSTVETNKSNAQAEVESKRDKLSELESGITQLQDDLNGLRDSFTRIFTSFQEQVNQAISKMEEPTNEEEVKQLLYVADNSNTQTLRKLAAYYLLKKEPSLFDNLFQETAQTGGKRKLHRRKQLGGQENGKTIAELQRDLQELETQKNDLERDLAAKKTLKGELESLQSESVRLAAFITGKTSAKEKLESNKNNISTEQKSLQTTFDSLLVILNEILAGTTKAFPTSQFRKLTQFQDKLIAFKDAITDAVTQQRPALIEYYKDKLPKPYQAGNANPQAIQLNLPANIFPAPVQTLADGADASNYPLYFMSRISNAPNNNAKKGILTTLLSKLKDQLGKKTPEGFLNNVLTNNDKIRGELTLFQTLVLLIAVFQTSRGEAIQENYRSRIGNLVKSVQIAINDDEGIFPNIKIENHLFLPDGQTLLKAAADLSENKTITKTVIPLLHKVGYPENLAYGLNGSFIDNDGSPLTLASFNNQPAE